MRALILLIVCGWLIVFYVDAILNSWHIMADNLIENMRVDPILVNSNWSTIMQQAVDQQVNAFMYIYAAQNRQGPNSLNNSIMRQRRSNTQIAWSDHLSNGKNGSYRLVEFAETTEHTFQSVVVKDVSFLRKEPDVYAIFLTEDIFTLKTSISIYLLEKSTFKKIIAHYPIATYASKLFSFGNDDKVILVTYNNRNGALSILNYTPPSFIRRWQIIHQDQLRAVTMWSHLNTIFLATSYTNQEGGSSSSSWHSTGAIYKWRSRYFDIEQSLKTSGSHHMLPFHIGPISFLFVATASDIDNQLNGFTFSTIYKFNELTELYQAHQKLLTPYCNHSHFFSVGGSQNHFLVVANAQIGIQQTDGVFAYSILYQFVDGSFIPFQTFMFDSSVQWLSVQGPNKAPILMAHEHQKNTVHIFQYNGWNFTSIKPMMPMSLLQGSRLFSPQPNLVYSVTARTIQTFTLRYAPEGTRYQTHKNLLDWCETSRKRLHSMSKWRPKRTTDDGSQRADIAPINLAENLAKAVVLNHQIDDIQKEFLLSKRNNTQLTISPTINVTEIYLHNNNSHVADLRTNTLNGLNITVLMANVLSISKGFSVKELRFDQVAINSQSSFPASINNGNNLVRKSAPTLHFQQLNVNGTLRVASNTLVLGTINNQRIDNEHIITHKRQTFDTIAVHNVTVDHMRMRRLMSHHHTTTPRPLENAVITHIPTLRVSELFVGGYLNDVHLPSLDRHALKWTGNQTIEAVYAFETAEADNLDVNRTLNERHPFDFVWTDFGQFSVRDDVNFEENLDCNVLDISGHLNGIPSRNGQLDILRTDGSAAVQHISGRKVFEKLTLENPIRLQGRIESQHLDRMNPLVTVEHNVSVDGDFAITGNVRVEKLLLAHDIASNDRRSFAAVQQHALRLTDTHIPMKMYLLQQIHVNDTITDRINDNVIDNWVQMGSKERQAITGAKTFLGSVHINGSTTSHRINHIDVLELEENVLKVHSNQTISGTFHVKNLSAVNITAQNVTFDGHPFSDIVRNFSSTKLNSQVFIKNGIRVRDLRVGKVTVGGQFNGYNFTDMVLDTVRLGDENRTITGPKQIHNLTVRHLDVTNLKANTGRVKDFWTSYSQRNVFEINRSVHWPVLHANHIQFTDHLNGMSVAEFVQDEIASIDPNIHTIHANALMDNITIYGTLYVASNRINNYNITQIDKGTYKRDRPYNVTTAIFEQTIESLKPITVDGHIEMVDLDNILLPNSSEPQTILDEKYFNGGLVVNGSVHFDGILNGLNVSQFCKFQTTNEKGQQLIVLGNATITKTPDIDVINDVPFNEFRKNVWFSDRTAHFRNANVQFEDIIMEDNITISGYVNSVNLSALAESYLSRTKNQTISKVITFGKRALVTFENGLSVPLLTIDTGLLNDHFNINHFVQNVLLQDYDQLFERPVFFETFVPLDLQGEYTVNQLNLATDIMRYDKQNIVTGTKTFDNLTVGTLVLPELADNAHMVRIQGVDVLDWLRRCVLLDVPTNVTGDLNFNDTVVNFLDQIQFQRSLNGRPFDAQHILLRNLPQNVTGRKTFHSNMTTFKSIKLKQLLNGIDFTKTATKLAYKNVNNIFRGPMQFNNSIKVDNVIFKGMYQGTNVSSLLANITNLGSLNNLMDLYENLQDIMLDVQNSLKKQAYFIQYLKLIQTVSPAQRVVYANHRLFTHWTNVSFSQVSIYLWDPIQMQFIEEKEHPELSAMNYITFIDTLFDRYLYIEAVTPENQLMGHWLLADSTLQAFYTIPLNSTTQSLVSFRLPNKQPCALFIQNVYQPMIMCESNQGLYMYQTLESSIGYKATSLTIDETPYLIVLDNHSDNGQPDNFVTTWHLSTESNQFVMHQVWSETEACSLAAIQYRDKSFVAVASGRIPNTIYAGRVNIKLFDKKTGRFSPWQTIHSVSPLQLQFAALASDELVLYILTDNPNEPLLMYRYEGIAGFRQKIVGHTLPLSDEMMHFSLVHTNPLAGGYHHFVVTHNRKNFDLNVLQAVFKGNANISPINNGMQMEKQG